MVLERQLRLSLITNDDSSSSDILSLAFVRAKASGKTRHPFRYVNIMQINILRHTKIML